METADIDTMPIISCHGWCEMVDSWWDLMTVSFQNRLNQPVLRIDLNAWHLLEVARGLPDLNVGSISTLRARYWWQLHMFWGGRRKLPSSARIQCGRQGVEFFPFLSTSECQLSVRCCQVLLLTGDKSGVLLLSFQPLIPFATGWCTLVWVCSSNGPNVLLIPFVAAKVMLSMHSDPGGPITRPFTYMIFVPLLLWYGINQACN